MKKEDTQGLFNFGFILSLIAVVVDTIVSGVLSFALLGAGYVAIALMTFAILALEIYCMTQYKVKKGAIVCLLVIAVISILFSFGQGSLPIFAIALAIGTGISLGAIQE